MRTWLLALLAAVAAGGPVPDGRLIDLGGRKLHLHCEGRGAPTVVVENGLGDFSFDWVLVQRGVARVTRVCTYDRAGYAWSDPGIFPRTFAQLNLELKTALARAGERTPLVLVGHSFGGGVVRAYTERYPADVVGLVFVDIVAEQQYIRMGPHAGRVGDSATGRPIPEPRLPSGAPPAMTPTVVNTDAPIESPYDRLPIAQQRLHAWASAQPGLETAEDSQREWSAESFARWLALPQAGTLGSCPLVVLTRKNGGYGDGLDKPAAELERTRLDAQRALAALSTTGRQQLVDAGHNMHLEVPEIVVAAIRDVVTLAREPRSKR